MKKAAIPILSLALCAILLTACGSESTHTTTVSGTETVTPSEAQTSDLSSRNELETITVNCGGVIFSIPGYYKKDAGSSNSFSSEENHIQSALLDIDEEDAGFSDGEFLGYGDELKELFDDGSYTSLEDPYYSTVAGLPSWNWQVTFTENGVPFQAHFVLINHAAVEKLLIIAFMQDSNASHDYAQDFQNVLNEARVDDGMLTTLNNIWKLNYYVDDFKQPTNNWYIANTVDTESYFEGKYSNSISTNDDLHVIMLVDEEKITFMFLQYYPLSNEPMKNSYSMKEDYNIILRLSDDTRHEMTGTMPSGADRIKLDSQYRDTVLAALSGTDDFMIRFEESNSNTFYDKRASYLFTVHPGNFSEIYAEAVGT